MGDDIPIEAQIVSVADVYDALVSVRIYKEALAKKYEEPVKDEKISIRSINGEIYCSIGSGDNQLTVYRF